MSWESITGLTVPSPPPDNTDSANFNFRFPDYGGDSNVWGYGLNGNWFAIDYVLNKFVTDATWLPLFLPKAGGEMSGDMLFATTGAKCGTTAKPASEAHFLAWSVHAVPGGAVNASCTTAGVITGTNVTSTSDQRLKRDIETADCARLYLAITALAPKTFVRIGDETNTRELGLIAQDVQHYLPECVGKDENGNLTISWPGMISALIGAFRYAQQGR